MGSLESQKCTPPAQSWSFCSSSLFHGRPGSCPRSQPPLSTDRHVSQQLTVLAGSRCLLHSAVTFPGQSLGILIFPLPLCGGQGAWYTVGAPWCSHLSTLSSSLCPWQSPVMFLPSQGSLFPLGLRCFQRSGRDSAEVDTQTASCLWAHAAHLSGFLFLVGLMGVTMCHLSRGRGHARG